MKDRKPEQSKPNGEGAEERISGFFPGGPGRADPAADRERRARLRGGEDREAARADREVTSKQKRRRRRLVIGAVAMLVLAATLSVVVMDTGPQTAAESIEAEAQEGGVESEIDSRIDRILDELWKMEEVERSENRRGGR